MPTSTPTPGFALSDTDAAQILLRYDGRTFVLYNRDASNNAVVRNLNFRLFEVAPPSDDDEEDAEPRFVETNIFRATEWGDLSAGILGNACLQVWTINYRFLPLDEAPADMCGSRTYYRSTVRPFWVSDAPEQAYFEVRRGAVDVIAVCPVNIPDTFAELRCVVPLD